jgi:para-aminobenzoate synthetase component 1
VQDAFAIAGGRLFTELIDLSGDLTVLDSSGRWIVVLPFAGPPICARFERVEPAPRPSRSAWCGPARQAWSSSLDRKAFGEAVQSVREAIACGDVYQVNVCRVLSAALPLRSADIGALFGSLGRANPAPFAAAVHLPEAGVELASASPELYLRRAGARVESHPIKGTAAHPTGFLGKDRAENVMIVDLVRNDLGRVCEHGSVAVPHLCRVEAHPGLYHFVSTVTGQLRAGVGWPELVEATFPPGSVTGAPKLAALRIIDSLEPVPRGPYCGAIGWVDADRGVGELNVAIRTFWANDGRLHFGTGGAITWDSTAEGEWQETVLKAHHLIGLASPLSMSLEKGAGGRRVG